MQGDYQSADKLLIRKSLFAYAEDLSFAKRLLPEFVCTEPGMSILDVGCGTGDDLATIAATTQGCTLIGIDASEGMIEEAKKRTPSANFFVANMETFSLPDRFDRIIVRHALHLADDKVRAMKNIVHHLASKGKAIFALHSTQSLPKISALIDTFCKKKGITFLQGKDALAGETSTELFAPYNAKLITIADIITLLDPEPYIQYISSRKRSFVPNISEEDLEILLTQIRRFIEEEIKKNGKFTEISANGIVTIEA